MWGTTTTLPGRKRKKLAKASSDPLPNTSSIDPCYLQGGPARFIRRPMRSARCLPDLCAGTAVGECRITGVHQLMNFLRWPRISAASSLTSANAKDTCYLQGCHGQAYSNAHAICVVPSWPECSHCLPVEAALPAFTDYELLRWPHVSCRHVVFRPDECCWLSRL
jgi:hypothetical protein